MARSPSGKRPDGHGGPQDDNQHTRVRLHFRWQYTCCLSRYACVPTYLPRQESRSLVTYEMKSISAYSACAPK